MFGSFDPLVGHAYSSDDIPARNGESQVPGFVVYGDPSASGDALRIIALGGSTTTPHFERCWPKQLHELLIGRGIAALVFNGGVSGYSSSQELLKLTRDAPALAPDIIVSYSGINDVGFLHSSRKHPMIHRYVEQVLADLLMRNTPTKSRKGSVTELSLGVPQNDEPADVWIRNARMMGAIASVIGAEYLCFLQPTLGVGHYQLNEQEEEMLFAYNTARRGKYLTELSSFYKHASSLLGPGTPVLDLQDGFARHEGVYFDCRHPNADGYGVVARLILNALEEKGLIS